MWIHLLNLRLWLQTQQFIVVMVGEVLKHLLMLGPHPLNDGLGIFASRELIFSQGSVAARCRCNYTTFEKELGRNSIIVGSTVFRLEVEPQTAIAETIIEPGIHWAPLGTSLSALLLPVLFLNARVALFVREYD